MSLLPYVRCELKQVFVYPLLVDMVESLPLWEVWVET